MTGYPPLAVALLQGLIAAFVVCVPPLALAFGGRLKVSVRDVVLMILVLPGGALVTTAVFLPFEGDWVDRAFGPLVLMRPLIVGGSIVLLGTIVTQWRNLVKRGPLEVAHRLGAVFVIGAVWGVLWGLAGWFLKLIGMANNG
ncbi:MAG: hypothetical protein V4574_15775 [Pseudomonadota bacterium]